MKEGITKSKQFLVWPIVQIIFYVILLGAIIFAIRVFTDPQNLPNFSDFDVYFRAGERATDGMPIYHLTDGWYPYKYAPFIAFCFGAFSHLEIANARWLWYVLSIAVWFCFFGMWAWKLWKKNSERCSVDKMRAIFYLAIPVLIFAFAVPLRDELKLGQANGIALLFASLTILLIGKKPFLAQIVAGLVFSLAIQCKLYPLILVPILIVRKQYAMLIWTVIWTVFLNVLLLGFFHGLTFAWQENVRWIQLLYTTTGNQSGTYDDVALIGILTKNGVAKSVQSPIWLGAIFTFLITDLFLLRKSVISSSVFALAAIPILNPLVWPYWMLFATPLFLSLFADIATDFYKKSIHGVWVFALCSLMYFTYISYYQNEGFTHSGAILFASIFLVAAFYLYEMMPKNFLRRTLVIPMAKKIPGLSIVWLLLIVGVLLRFLFLRSIEFKADEMTALNMAFENIRNPLALTGLMSSIGIPNPPGFIYIVSIPALITRNPIALTAFIAAINVVGIYLLFIFLRKHFSGEIALWATALFASAPWPIIFSRKLWAQDLLFPFLIAFYSVFFSNIAKYHRIKTYGAFLLLAIATQLHMSAWFLPIPLLVFVVAARIRFPWKDVVGGVLLFLAAYIPYFLSFSQKGLSGLNGVLSQVHVVSFATIFERLHWMLYTSTGLGLKYLLGGEGIAYMYSMYPIGWAVPLMFILVFAEIITICFTASLSWRVIRDRWQGKQVSTGMLIMLCFFVIVIVMHALYFLFGIAAFPHYQIVFYPIITTLTVVMLFTLGGSIEGERNKMHVYRFLRTFLLAIIVAHLTVSIAFISLVRNTPNVIDGDYGIPYFLQHPGQ